MASECSFCTLVFKESFQWVTWTSSLDLIVSLTQRQRLTEQRAAAGLLVFARFCSPGGLVHWRELFHLKHILLQTGAAGPVQFKILSETTYWKEKKNLYIALQKEREKNKLLTSRLIPYFALWGFMLHFTELMQADFMLISSVIKPGTSWKKKRGGKNMTCKGTINRHKNGGTSSISAPSDDLTETHWNPSAAKRRRGQAHWNRWMDISHWHCNRWPVAQGVLYKFTVRRGQWDLEKLWLYSWL